MMHGTTSRYLAILKDIKTRPVEEEGLSTDSRPLVIDGLNTFIRSYAASPVLNDDGEHVGGISGFLLSIGHAIKAINPTRVIIVFDGKNGSARRRQIYPEYKANRSVKVKLNRSLTVEKQDNQLQQLVRLIEYLTTLPVSVVIQDDAEADDVIAYIVNEFFPKSHCYIMSSDKDFLQLVSDRIHLWSPTKKKLYYTEDVVEEYSVYPHNFALYRAVLGDDSDNISGVKGVGVKTLFKKFPIITSPEKLSLEMFMDSVNKSEDKSKVSGLMKEAEPVLSRNMQIMQLGTSTMSVTNKLKTQSLLRQPIPTLAKPAFHRMLIEDKMTTAIRNVDFWLKEVMQKLSLFASLKD